MTSVLPRWIARLARRLVMLPRANKRVLMVLADAVFIPAALWSAIALKTGSLHSDLPESLWVYPIAVLALWHFFLQTKLDVTQPVLMLGFFVWLMLFRLMRRLGWQARPLQLLGLALISALTTALLEALWYATMTGVMASRILAANLDIAFGIRPSLWVLAAGLAVAGIGAVRLGLKPAPRPKAA